jgi:sugar-specific transcriptional regulator TrmB
MQPDYTILEHLGLGKNEIKVYLRLHKIGPSSPGNIAEKLDIHRPNVYDALEKLVAKGLITYIFSEGKKLFQASDPENLLGMLHNNEVQLKKLIAELKVHKNLAEKKTTAHLFEGIQGIKKMTDDQLTEGVTVYSFGIPHDVAERMKSFLNIYHERRIAKGMAQFHLYNEDARERIAYLNTLSHTKASFLPEEYDSPATTNVYGDTVSFFIWGPEPFGVMIKEQRMADSYRRYFRLLWKIATGEKLEQ